MAINLVKILSDSLKVASDVVSSLEVDVVHKPILSEDRFGKRTYGDAQNLKALYEPKIGQRILSSTGAIVNTSAKLTFLKVPDALNIPLRRDPFDGRDFIAVQGIENRDPIVDIDGGVINPANSKPFVVIIWLGVLRGT